MNVLVIGPGAIGCMFSHRAARSGAAVTVATRGLYHSEKVGIQIRFPSKNIMETTQVRVVPCNDLQLQPYDVVLVTVKSKDTGEVGLMLRRGVEKGNITLETPVISLQNGMGNLEILNDAIGLDIAVPGLTYVGAIVREPFIVENTGLGKTLIGSCSPAHPTFRNLTAFTELLKNDEVFLTDSILNSMWTKLLVNICINPIATILNMSNSCVLLPNIEPLLDSLISEFIQVAKKENIELQLGRMNEKEYVKSVAFNSGTNICSMLADVRRKQPTEIESLNGFVLKKAKLHNIETPVCATMYQLIKGISV